jgi:hypothetical protein
VTDTVPGRYVHLPDDLDTAHVMRGPARFRKLPVEIEAMRYIPPSHLDPERSGNQGDIADWANGDPDDWADGDDVRLVIQPTQHWGLAGHPQCWDLLIQTLEDGVEGGTQVEHVVSPGDWVVKGVSGEFYPVKAAIFAQTYEAVRPTAYREAQP